MALAVLDLDVLDLPDILPVAPHHEGAHVLLRIGGRPVGQAVIALHGDDAAAPLSERLFRHADSAFWEAWLRHQLGVAPSTTFVPDAALPSVTIVICTRDRTEDLLRCLTDLLSMPDEGQDILVVDNAPSNDGTRDLVAGFPTVRYVREARPGLDVARNTALRAVERDILAFIDDDAAPDRLWLHRLRRNFGDPLVLAATGLTLALELETDAQVAFQRVGGFSRGMKRTVYEATNCNPFHGWHAGAGVNMAIRRSIVENIGFFDEALDAGTLSLAGGDTDMCRRILEGGYRILYDPQAVNWHRHRRTMEELKTQIYGYEAAAFAILTKALLFERNPAALAELARWLRYQIPAVARSMRRGRHDAPFNVAWAQACGAMSGPGRYLKARRKLRHG